MAQITLLFRRNQASRFITIMQPATLACHPHAPESPHEFHVRLNRFNLTRLAPSVLDGNWRNDLHVEQALRLEEGDFVERERRSVLPMVSNIPSGAPAFARCVASRAPSSVHWPKFAQSETRGS